MILFTIETPEIKAVAYAFHDKMQLSHTRPYRLEVTDRATGKTEVKEANNTCIFKGFLAGQEHRTLQLEREAWMRSQGYERKTPYARWEKVRK